MINMENREITPESIIKNSEHDCTPTIILYKTQWHTVYDWMQEYSDQQNKRLLDEIEELKSTVKERTSLAIDYVNQIDMLKFQLKAADSVNENLSKQVEWISVKDRLPTERVEFVLLFNADAPKYNQCVYQGVWFLQEKKFKSDTVHNLLGTITHWMPLPNQPK